MKKGADPSQRTAPRATEKTFYCPLEVKRESVESWNPPVEFEETRTPIDIIEPVELSVD